MKGMKYSIIDQRLSSPTTQDYDFLKFFDKDIFTLLPESRNGSHQKAP